MVLKIILLCITGFILFGCIGLGFFSTWGRSNEQFFQIATLIVSIPFFVIIDWIRETKQSVT